MFTIWPPSRRCGRQRRVIRIRPLTLVSSTVCSSASELSSNRSLPGARPAALTRMSMPPPSSSTAARANRSQLAESVTSSSSGVTDAGIRSVRRAPPTTRAPSRASVSAVAAPMPLEAPVTTADLPSRLGTGGLYFLVRSERAAPGNGFAQLDRRRCALGVLDLQRRVRQPEALHQGPLEASPGRMAIGAWLDEHVRRERRKAAGHGPDVEIVHLDDVLLLYESASDRLRIGLARRALEEDQRRLAEELRARPEHQRCHEEARDRVEPVPARSEDQPAGERGGGERS